MRNSIDGRYISTLEAWNRAKKKGDKAKVKVLGKKIDKLEKEIGRR